MNDILTMPRSVVTRSDSSTYTLPNYADCAQALRAEYKGNSALEKQAAQK